MPRIPIQTPRATPNGTLQGRVGVQGLDLSPIARGATALADSIDREQDYYSKQRDVADNAEARNQVIAFKDSVADAYEAHQAGILDGTIDKTSAKSKWTELTKPLLEQTLEKIPPSQRALFGGQLKLTSDNLERKLDRVVAQKDRKDIAGAIDSQLEYAARWSQTDYAGARHMAMQTLMELGPFAGLDSATIQKKANAWKEEAAYTRGLAVLTTGKRDNASLTRAEQVISGMDDIDPRRKVELLDRAAGYKIANDQRDEMEAQRREREAERRLRKAEHEFNAFNALADKGGALSPEYVDQVVKATAGTPYQAAARGIAQRVREVGGLALRPITDQRAILAQIDQEIATKGRSPELDKRREQIAKVVRSSEADAEKDPMAGYAERGGGVAPAVDLSSIDGFLKTLPARVDHAVAVGTWAKRTVSPLTEQEADAFATQLGALPLEQRSARIAQLSQVMAPGQAQALAKQMDGKNKALALEFAAGSSMTQSGKFVAEWIARGNQAIKDKAIKEDSTAQSGLRAQIAAEVGDSLTGKTREDVIAAARLAYLGQQAAGLDPSPKGAVSLVVGGPIVEHNGKRIPVPVNVQDIAASVRAYPHAKLEAQTPDGFVYLQGGRPMGLPEFMAALPEAQLEPAGAGRYHVRAGGGLAYSSDRKPIVIDLR